MFCDVWLDCVSLAYQRVQKVDCTSPRPVLLLGPLVDPVKDMLVKESPGKFSRCVLGELTLAHSNPQYYLYVSRCIMLPHAAACFCEVYMDLVIVIFSI